MDADTTANGAAGGRPEAVTRAPQRLATPWWLVAASGFAWRILVVAGVVWLLVWVLSKLGLVVLPLALAAALATVLAPLVRWLRRRGLPHLLAVIIAFFGGLVVAGAVVGLPLWAFVNQLGPLGETLQSSRETIMDWLRTGPLAMSGQQINDLVERMLSELRQNARAIIGGAVGGAVLLAEVVAGALLALVLTYFLVKDGEGISRWLLQLFPPRQQRLAASIGRRARDTVAAYARGVLIIAIADAVGIGLGLFLIGVPLVFPLAALVFVGAFIPVVGAFVSGLVAVLVALVSGGFVDALLVFGVVVAVQQIEGNVLQPVVMGREVAVHPVVVLLALTAGGVVAGIPGAALAVPVVAVLSAVGNEVRRHYDGETRGAVPPTSRERREPAPRRS